MKPTIEAVGSVSLEVFLDSRGMLGFDEIVDIFNRTLVSGLVEELLDFRIGTDGGETVEIDRAETAANVPVCHLGHRFERFHFCVRLIHCFDRHQHELPVMRLGPHKEEIARNLEQGRSPLSDGLTAQLESLFGQPLRNFRIRQPWVLCEDSEDSPVYFVDRRFVCF